jgi:hypothetical protein
MGSGKWLKRAINKHGVENFTKEILFVFENEIEMNEKEKELVVLSEESYNLCDGGGGGFGYIIKNGLNKSENQKEAARRNLEEKNIRQHVDYEKCGKRICEWVKENGQPLTGWLGRKHSDETKEKISAAKKGKPPWNKGKNKKT